MGSSTLRQSLWQVCFLPLTSDKPKHTRHARFSCRSFRLLSLMILTLHSHLNERTDTKYEDIQFILLSSLLLLLLVFRFPALHFTPRNEWRSSFTAQWKELFHLQTSYCLENNSITQLPLQWAFHTMGGPILCRHRHSPEQKQSCSR